MIEVKKSERESSAALIRRFTKKIRQSHILARARGLQFKKRPISKQKSKIEAIKKVKTQRRMQYMRKLGKIE